MNQTLISYTAQIQLREDLEFPGIDITDFYHSLCARGDDLEVLSLEPSIFPGMNRTQEEIDQQYQYQLFFATTLDKGALRDLFLRIIREKKIGLSRIGLKNNSGNKSGEQASGARVEPDSSAGTTETDAQKNEPNPVDGVGIASGNGKQPLPVAGNGSGSRGAGTSMRVDLEKIEELVNLVGELIISKNQIESAAKTSARKKDRSDQEDFENAFGQLESVTNKLRDLSLGVRMVPVQQTLRKFPALVRDLARKTGKQVKLILRGEETEIDKIILEAIADPLTHIIRNAVDHGIEDPTERIAAGKDPEGVLLIMAETEGDQIHIILEDDGRGLSTEPILEKALEKEIITPAEADRMSTADIRRLIFHPGFSTRSQVSDVSGRGVGMDVVRNNIGQLNGSISLDTAPGKGTRFTLKLPLTLSILDGLLLRDGEDVFAVPLVAIEQSRAIRAGQLQTFGKYHLFQQDGETLPVFKLNRLLATGSAGPTPEEHDTGAETVQPVNDNVFLIEAITPEGHFGLVVDEIIGRQEIVIKPLGNYLGKIPGISGGTILGNGRVALILDIKSIGEIMGEEKPAHQVAEEAR